MRRSGFAVLLCTALLTQGLQAQVDEDELFGEPIVTDEVPVLQIAEYEPATRLGGTFRFDVEAEYGWQDPRSLEDIMTWPGGGITTGLSALLYVDARPFESFRVYGEAEASYPFVEEEDRDFDQILTITELFSDFRLGDSLFIRGGKQTVTWGVGYFFSPADIINIERIDPEDPERDREGPVAARFQVPAPASNLYLYLLPPVGNREQFVWAPKAELAIGRFEFGLGAYVQRTQGFTAMFTGSGSVRRVSLFGEVTLEDSDRRTYVRQTDVTLEIPLGVETFTKGRAPVSATIGASYSPRDTTGRFGIRAVAQYFYNGDGYEDSAILREEQAAIAALLASGAILPEDLVETGTHYAAALVSWRDIMKSDFSAAVSWYGNLTELAGRVRWTVSAALWDRVDLESGLTYTYGENGSESAPDGTRLDLGWSVGLGNGAF